MLLKSLPPDLASADAMIRTTKEAFDRSLALNVLSVEREPEHPSLHRN